MKIALTVLTTMIFMSWAARAATDETSQWDGTYPAGLEYSVAREIVSGKLVKAVIPDKVGVVGRGLSFQFPWLTRDVQHSDHVVSYRNGTWFTQPLPVRHESVPDRVHTFALLLFCAASATLFVLWLLPPKKNEWSVRGSYAEE